MMSSLKTQISICVCCIWFLTGCEDRRCSEERLLVMHMKTMLAEIQLAALNYADSQETWRKTVKVILAEQFVNMGRQLPNIETCAVNPTLELWRGEEQEEIQAVAFVVNFKKSNLSLFYKIDFGGEVTPASEIEFQKYCEKWEGYIFTTPFKERS